MQFPNCFIAAFASTVNWTSYPVLASRVSCDVFPNGRPSLRSLATPTVRKLCVDDPM
jgi:hypothetical protein